MDKVINYFIILFFKYIKLKGLAILPLSGTKLAASLGIQEIDLIHYKK